MNELSPSLYSCLKRIARGKSAQLGPNAGGVGFAVLAGMLQERGLVRTVKHRDGTRTYTPTPEGRVYLTKARTP